MKRLLSSLTDTERAAYFAEIDKNLDCLIAAAPSKCQECATPLSGRNNLILCDACVCMLGIEAGDGRGGKRGHGVRTAKEFHDSFVGTREREIDAPEEKIEEDTLPAPFELVALKLRAQKLAGKIAFASNETAEHIEYKIFKYIARMHYRESYAVLTFWQFDIGLRVLEGIQQYESAAVVINELRKTERKRNDRAT